MKSKKADIGFGVVLLILVIVLFLGWLVNEGWKECKGDADCKKGEYCTSSFDCRAIPPQSASAEYASPLVSLPVALVIGLSLIIAAIILKWDVLFKDTRFAKDKKTTHAEAKAEGKSMAYNAENRGLYEDILDEEKKH